LAGAGRLAPFGAVHAQIAFDQAAGFSKWLQVRQRGRAACAAAAAALPTAAQLRVTTSALYQLCRAFDLKSNLMMLCSHCYHAQQLSISELRDSSTHTQFCCKTADLPDHRHQRYIHYELPLQEQHIVTAAKRIKHILTYLILLRARYYRSERLTASSSLPFLLLHLSLAPPLQDNGKRVCDHPVCLYVAVTLLPCLMLVMFTAENAASQCNLTACCAAWLLALDCRTLAAPPLSPTSRAQHCTVKHHGYLVVLVRYMCSINHSCDDLLVILLCSLLQDNGSRISRLHMKGPALHSLTMMKLPWK
jgi:hypothetical protein